MKNNNQKIERIKIEKNIWCPLQKYVKTDDCVKCPFFVRIDTITNEILCKRGITERGNA